MASYTNGDFVATGIRITNPPDTNDWPVLARRFNASGVPYGPPFCVSTTTSGYTAASASYGSDGRFAIAWPSHTKRALFRVYPPNDSSPPSSELVANSISTPTGPVKARYNRSNELLVVWSGVLTPIRRDCVFVRRYDANLRAEGGELEVSETACGNRWNVDLSIGSNGETVVSWVFSTNIYARLLDAGGNPIGHEFRVNRVPEGVHKLGWEACPHTAVLNDGSLVFIWGGNGTGGDGLYLTFFKAVGSSTHSNY